MIVIPMAGLSSRFFNAGYPIPKYQLGLPNSQSVFEWAVTSFEEYFHSDHFVFIIRDVFNTKFFVENCINQLGIGSFSIVVLEDETEGQADTVYQGLKKISETISEHEELFIFNIDSRRTGFRKSTAVHNKDIAGYLEVFEGEGDHWSFIKVDNNGKVILTTEKERISNLCSNGLYYFRSIKLFNELFEQEYQNRRNSLVKSELYIAPLYNYLIQNNLAVDFELVDHSKIEFCGVPTEYEALCTKMKRSKQ